MSTRLLKVAAISIGIIISLSAAEIFLRVQKFVKLDRSSHPEYTWHNVLHHGNDKFGVTDYGSNCNGKKIKLLLLGDSWMEDEYLSSTLGQEMANKSGKCVQAINGGTSSYSPSLYLLKARQAFNAYGKFDYIIVNIDETDIGDEWLRYRIPTIRDTSGKIAAVSYEHDLRFQFWWNGVLWAENSHCYIIRLIKHAFHFMVLMPLHDKFTHSDGLPSLMQYLYAPDARSLYKREHEYFESRLLEMAAEVSNYTTDATHVYVTHHPHLRGLVNSIDNGKLYLPIVSEALARLMEKSGVVVLDARNHVMQIHGEALLKDTFKKGDPLSHLASQGAIRYGKWIVSQINLE